MHSHTALGSRSSTSPPVPAAWVSSVSSSPPPATRAMRLSTPGVLSRLIPIVVAIAGAISVQVPLVAQARHDFAAMAAAITPRTRLILVCTPNNPTGPVVHQDELDAFLDTVPADILVVIDEAYVEFVTDKKAPDALATYHGRPNVAVLRTFSKAYGLAGLRVGYAVAHEPVAQALRKTAVPFGVSTIAQQAAIASMDAFDELQG